MTSPQISSRLSLSSAWRQLVKKSPHTIAWISLEKRNAATRLQLDKTAQLLSLYLLEDLRGAWIAFSEPNSMLWIVKFLAILKSGGVCVPLDGNLDQKTAINIARSAGAHFYWSENKLQSLKSSRRCSRCQGVVKLTSGTTGEPKAIECKSRHLIADGWQIIKTMGIKPKDINLGLIPLGHSYGLGNLVMPLLLQGTPVASAQAFVPSQIDEWIERHKLTVFPTVPSIISLLSKSTQKYNLKRLRLCISAGAPLDSTTAQEFYSRFNKKVHNFYGSSETGGIAYDKTGTATISGRSLGTVMEGVQVAINKGRVQVTSPAVVSNSHTFILQDLGEITSKNELRLLGRTQPIANIGGRKVSPNEVQSALRKSGCLGEILIFIVKTKGRDRLIAAAESSLSQNKVIENLKKIIPSWKIPSVMQIKPQLPRNNRGKLDRAKIEAELGLI